jgi:hypothetical protein
VLVQAGPGTSLTSLAKRELPGVPNVVVYGPGAWERAAPGRAARVSLVDAATVERSETLPPAEGHSEHPWEPFLRTLLASPRVGDLVLYEQPGLVSLAYRMAKGVAGARSRSVSSAPSAEDVDLPTWLRSATAGLRGDPDAVEGRRALRRAVLRGDYG